MGMFDLTPEQVPLAQQQADTQQAMNAANLPEGRGGVYAASIAGNMLGRGIAGAMGYQDPRMAMAQKMQDAMNETNASGIDFATNPVAYYGMAAKNLAKRGLYDQAFAAQGKVKEASQAGLEQAQTAAALKTATQQDAAEKRVAFILQQTGGDRFKASQMMAMDANPLVQKRGEELAAKRFVPATEYGNIDTFADGTTPTIVGGDNAHTPLGKLQNQLTQYKTARDTMVKGNAPQSALDAMDERIEETKDNIETTSKGKPNTTGIDRAAKVLADYQDRVDGGEKLSAPDLRKAQLARAYLEQRHEAVDPVTGKSYFVQPYTIPESITVGRGSGGGGGGAGGAPVNGLPSMDGGRKGLDSGTEKVFRDMGNGLQQIDALVSGFKPEFGGFVSNSAGEGAILGGRKGIDRWAPTANWWQQYRQWGTDVRAAKFGMTLTGYELKAFDSYMVQPGDSADLIQKNIGRQKALIDKATQRELAALNASGQNVKQAEALSGTTMLTKQPMPQQGKPPQPTPQMPQPQPQQVAPPMPDDAIVKPMSNPPLQTKIIQAPPNANVINGARIWAHEGRLYRQNPDGSVDSRPAGK